MKNKALLLSIVMMSFAFVNLQAKEKKTNIIVILVDDMGYSDLGCTGSEINTPNLDKMAENGVLFTHFYNTARCCPSRAAILTGLTQHQSGIGHMDGTVTDYPSYVGHLNESCVTIAEVLGQEGYQTIIAGKWHVGSQEPYWPMKRGFQKEFSSPKGGGFYFYPPVGLNRPVYRNGVEQNITDPNWYSTDAFTTESMNFISEAKDDEKPFFLYLAYIAPHYPLQAFPEDIAKYDGVYDVGYDSIRLARYHKQLELGIIPEGTTLSASQATDWNSYSESKKQEMALRMQTYAAMIDRLDVNIGRLNHHLDSLGLADNTAIFFVSDNGGASAWHDKQGDGIGTSSSFVSYGESWANVSNTPYRKYKKQTHEGGIISPMIAYWPEKITQGKMTHEPAHITDFMATCLDIAKVDYPEEYNGHTITPLAGESVLPLIEGGAQRRDRIFTWEHEGNRAIRIHNWKLVESYNQGWELYDLKEDPTELNNLIAQYPDTADMLMNKYRQEAFRTGIVEWKVKNPKTHNFDALNPSSVSDGLNITNFDGSMALITPGSVDDYVEYSVPVYIAGNYTISLKHKKTNTRGIYNIYIDGVLVKENIDAYATNDEAETLVLSRQDVEKQSIKVKLEFVGQNAASSGNSLGLQSISLNYNGLPGETRTIEANNDFPLPAFDGFVVQNLADNTYNAPDYGEQRLKLKQKEGSERLSYLFFDLSKIDDSINEAGLRIYYEGSSSGSLPQNSTDLLLYTATFDLAMYGEPSWTTLAPYNGFDMVASYALSAADQSSYIEIKSEALAQKLLEAKNSGEDYLGLILTMDKSISSTINVFFHNSSNSYPPEMTLYSNTAKLQTSPVLNFSTSPNPADKQLYINNLNHNTQYQVAMINSAGQIILAQNYTPGKPLNISRLTPGIYLLQVAHLTNKAYQYCMVK